jgi:EpsI family protein
MRSGARRYAATVGLLGIAAVASGIDGLRAPDRLALPLSEIPRQLAGWTAIGDDQLNDRVLTRLQPTTYLARTYGRGQDRISLFVAYFATQRAGGSLHTPKRCLPGAGWAIVRKDIVAVNWEGRPVEVNDYTIQKGSDSAVVLYWYQSRGRVVNNEYLGKLLLLRDAVLDGTTSGSIVRLTVQNQPESIEAAVRFASRLLPEIHRCLGPVK